MDSKITTDEVAEAEGLDYWQDVVCRTFFQADCYALSDRPFHGTISTTATPQIALSRISSQEQRVVRTQQHVRQTAGEVFLVNLQLSGTGAFSQDGREAVLRPGDFTCSDSTRPCEMNYTGDFEQLVFYMPRDVAARAVGSIDRLAAVTVRHETPMGSIVAPFLRQTAAEIGKVKTSTANRLSEIGVALVMAAVGELSPTGRSEQPWGRTAALHRAKAFIEAHAGDHLLNSAMVAGALGISLRYLQELFRDDEITPSEWIWRRRLEKARQELVDPAPAARRVSQIAFDCGFADLAHFSRRFKAAYGMAPRDFRIEWRRATLGAVK